MPQVEAYKHIPPDGHGQQQRKFAALEIYNLYLAPKASLKISVNGAPVLAHACACVDECEGVWVCRCVWVCMGVVYASVALA